MNEENRKQVAQIKIVRRHGVAVPIPEMKPGYYVTGHFTPKSWTARKSEGTGSCASCEQRPHPEQAWAFQHVPGVFCAKCAPDAEARSIELSEYNGSLGVVMNLLGRLVPRELRRLIDPGQAHDDPELVNVLEEGIETVRQVILDAVGDARDSVIIAVQTALAAARWEDLPAADPEIEDPKAAAVDRLERFITETVED